MSDFEDFVSKTNQAKTSDEIFSHFQDALKKQGFEHIVYSLVTNHSSLNRIAEHGIRRTYPEAWMNHYMSNEYFPNDPVCHESLKSKDPFTWTGMCNSRELKPIEQKIMNEATEFNLVEGIALPLHGHHHELAVVGLACETLDINTEKSALHLLRAYASQFHIAYSEYAPPSEFIETIKLTPREKEILLWAAEGKSDPVIADILNISYATVRFHMANIFKKLDANERTFAVVKALRLGLITPGLIAPANNTYHNR